jgi:hypothetical protein
LGLLQSAGLVAAPAGRWLLSGAAYDWLDQPAERQLYNLRQVWLFKPELTWRGLAPRRRQPTLDRRWRDLVLCTLGLVSELSPEVWTPAAALKEKLEVGGMMDWDHTAQNLPRVRRTSKDRTRSVVRFLLREILPAMGLVESRLEAGRFHLRPTHEAAAWLASALT